MNHIVIEREEVHKKKLTKFEIGLSRPNTYIIIINKTIEKWEFGQLEEINWNSLLLKFQNCQNKLLVELYGIHITKDFLKQLMEHRCLRKIYLLQLEVCIYDDDGFKEMLKIIPNKKLSSLFIEPVCQETFQIPKEVLTYVSRYFEYTISRYRWDYPDLTHFTDELLDVWVGGSKILKLERCRTGFSLNGIANLFKKCVENTIAGQIFHLGILPNVREAAVDAMLKYQAGDVIKRRYRELIEYKIENFNGRNCLLNFSIFSDPQF